MLAEKTIEAEKYAERTREAESNYKQKLGEYEK